MKTRYALAMTAVTIGLPAIAGAQDIATEAQARFSEGVKAYERRDFERARVMFLQSAALVPRGSVLRNLGLAEMELGRPVDALHHLREALALPDLDPARRTVTENDIRDAYAATGHIAVQTGAGATLTVDGQAVPGKAPFGAPVDVMPGTHALVATLAESSVRTNVEALAGAIVPAILPIEPAVSPPAPPVAEPSEGPTPTVLPPPPPPEAPSFWNPRRDVGLTLMIAGLASTAAGVYFYAQATDAENRANTARAGLESFSCGGPAPPPACSVANDAWSSQTTDATLNYVFLGIGAAGLAVGAVMLLWPASRSSVAIAPVLTPGGGALHVRGAF